MRRLRLRDRRGRREDGVRKRRDHGSRGWSDACEDGGRGCEPRHAGGFQTLGKAGKRRKREPLEGTGPCQHPDFTPQHSFEVLALRTAMINLCFLKPLVVICFSSHWKQVQYFLGHISYISTLEVVLKLYCYVCVNIVTLTNGEALDGGDHRSSLYMRTVQIRKRVQVKICWGPKP